MMSCLPGGDGGRAASCVVSLLVAVLALAAVPALAAPGTEADDDGASAESGREDELFGAPRSDTPVEGRSIDALLYEADQKLAIGGLLYLRLNGSTREGGAPESSPISSPNLLDLYLDARPDDRVRTYVRGRLVHDFTVAPDGADGGDTEPGGPELSLVQPRERSEVYLDQLWLNFDVARTLWVTLGRQPIRWGTGRFWQPTDFLNQQFRDPLTVFDERLGVSLVKLHLPVESLGWNFYALANLEGAGRPDEVGGALRAEILVGTTEVALSAAARKDDPLRLGASVSSGLWLFDLRADFALLHGVRRDFWRGELELETLTFPEAFSREDDWIPQLVLGGEIGLRYSDEDAVYLGAEWFWNDAGYEGADLYPWLLFQGDFTPFYLGRQYGGVYAFLPAPGRWNDTSFIGSLLSNLSDGSYLARLDVQTRVLTWLDLNVFAMWHFGRRGELNFGLDLPATPLVPGLEEGLSSPEPRLDLGIWLATRF